MVDLKVLDEYIKRNFGVFSILELVNDEFEKVYCYVVGRCSWKK